MGDDKGLPFWQVNVPPQLREADCPQYLAGLSEKDKAIIGSRDEDFEYMQWPQVRELIRSNRIDLFVRKPTDLRRYRESMHRLVEEHGSITAFVTTQRLQWQDPSPRGAPFTHPGDVRILLNEWPYGVDPSITHLVVWTKFKLEDDPATEELSPAARRQMDDFVHRTFSRHMRDEDVVYFRNWRSLQSVHAVEHFHVMLNKAPRDFLSAIVGEE